MTATLKAHSRSGKAKILASPKLVCANGREANFLAGGEIPLKITSRKKSHYLSNRYLVFKHILTSISMIGTSINTPTTVANDAPEDNPNRIADVAIATSK